MENYTGGTIELLLSGDIQTGATIFGLVGGVHRSRMSDGCNVDRRFQLPSEGV